MNLSKTFAAVQYASRKLLALNDEKINQILLAVADAAEERTDFILAENRKDLNRMDTSNPKYDRLMLTPERLKGIATDIRKVAKLPSPVGRVQKQGVMPNGLKIKRVSVPFGVIGIIYEARPNVSFDVFSLCLKSGNACILKGGSRDGGCHYQQRQDPSRQCMQCIGLPTRRRRPHERPARPLCTVAGKQRNYLCRYVCIRLSTRTLSGPIAERSYGRRLRYGILRL